MNRRTYLAGLGATGAAALAGCSSTGSDGSATTTTLPPNTVECDLVDYAFDPGTKHPLTIDAGTTVHFVWKTGGHNIVPKDQPSKADWRGESKIRGQGYTDDYTFTVPGKYHFICQPHVNLGMVGDIVVSESNGSGNATATNGSANASN